MPISKNITKEHVLRALKRIDTVGVENFKKPLGYDLLHKGKRYPPKEVLRIANKECSGEDVDLLSFNGGKPTNNPLIKLGFTIVLKGTNEPIGLDYVNKKIKSSKDIEKEHEHEEQLNTDLKLEVPSIRLLPMSESDPEFTGKSIEDLQKWFINELPYREYNFKKGMNADSDTLVLFQYKGHVIASAILEKKIMFEEENEGGYRGAYKFNHSTIAIFTPITFEEMKNIWAEFKGFNQSQQDLDVRQYDLLCQLLLNKDFRYVLNKDIDEETFQREMEKSKASFSKIVVDKPKKLNKRIKIGTSMIKWKRNPVVSKNAVVFAEYKCEYDNSHLCFKSNATGENYVEAHHLIPMEFQDQFENSLDVEANIISLCPLCHKTVHHAVFEEKEAILKKLYYSRKERLAKCGIDVTEDMLLTYYE